MIERMLRFFSVFVLIAAVAAAAAVFFRRRRFVEVDFFGDDGEDIWDEFYSDEWPFEWV